VVIAKKIDFKFRNLKIIKKERLLRRYQFSQRLAESASAKLED